MADSSIKQICLVTDKSTTFEQPTLGTQICVDFLKSQHLPQETLDEFASLDTDHDGVIKVSLDRYHATDVQNKIDVSGNNGSFNKLARLFTIIQVWPFNNHEIDKLHKQPRHKDLTRIQNDFYNYLLKPVLSHITQIPPSTEDTRVVLQGLKATGDFVHMLELAKVFQLLGNKYDENSDQRFDYYKIAEDYLFTAYAVASESSVGREKYLYAIDRELVGKVKPELQKILDHQHALLIKKPYLLAGTSTPVAGYVDEMAANGEVFFAVSLPADFLKDLGVVQNDDGQLVTRKGEPLEGNTFAQVQDYIRDYFTRREQIVVNRSAFNNKLDNRTYTLQPASVAFDSPSFEDDLYSGAFTYHLNQPRLNKALFKKENRIYFRVGFKLPQLAQELIAENPDRNIWKLDLTMKRGNTILRQVPGGLNFARKTTTNTDRYSGDAHIHLEDWLTVKKMAEGLLKRKQVDSADQLSETDKDTLDLIDRHYESVNRKFQLFMEMGEQEYREGKFNRDFMLGDLVDYINIARTLVQQGYYESNVRQFVWMINQYEQVVYAVGGNHDYHGLKYPKSQSLRHFWAFKDKFRSQFLKLADSISFPRSGGNEIDGVAALWTRHIDPSEEIDGEISFSILAERLFEELTAKDIFDLENDSFLGASLQGMGPYENYVVGLGNSFRQMMIDTGPEDFQFFLAVSKIFPQPVRKAIVRGYKLYVKHQEVQGKGPGYELWPAIIKEVMESNKRNEYVNVAGHYGPTFEGQGVDGMTDNRDMLRYPAALTFRLLMWYYRHEGKSTMRAYIAGHVHKYSETTFNIFFEPDEEPRFRAQLGEILKITDGKELMDELWGFAQEWEIPKRMNMSRVNEYGTNGYPGGIASLLKADQLNDPISLTALALSGNIAGGHFLTTANHGSGKMSFDTFVFNENSAGSLVIETGRNIVAFEESKREEAKVFDPKMVDKIAPYQKPSKPTQTTHLEPSKIRLKPVDWFPIFYENRNHFGLHAVALSVEDGVQFGSAGIGNLFHLSLDYLLPLPNRETNSLTHMDFQFALLRARINGHLESTTLQFNPLLVTKNFTAGPTFGVTGRGLIDSEIAAQFGVKVSYSLTPYQLFAIPNICAWGNVDTRGEWALGIGLCSQITLLTVQRMPKYRPTDNY